MLKRNRLGAIFSFCTLLMAAPAMGEVVPEISEQCRSQLESKRECLVSRITCDNFLCLTGEFHHDLYIRIPRSAIGRRNDAIRKITRFEMWPQAVLRRDPGQNTIKVHKSLRGPFRYDSNNELLEAIQYADFEANSPIGWQPMTLVTRFSMVSPANNPSFGTTFLTTRIHVDTGFNVSSIGSNLPWSRGVKLMDGNLHLVEEYDRPDSVIAVYSHNLRIAFDLAPNIAQTSISNVIRTMTVALIDIVSTEN